MFIVVNSAIPLLAIYTTAILNVDKTACTRVFVSVVLIMVKSKNNYKTNQ